jgi:hypothetical protein
MALKFFDRTKQDATTTGTGTFTLATSASTGGFRTFASVHTTGDQVFYCAVDNVNNTFEVGEGTLTSGSPNWTLSRTVIKSSSNSNNVVNFGAAPEIFSTYPAENAAFSDTGLSSNVVETDAIFTQTLTANKALSGQFKGTLQFNKAFFTSSDYTVASGQTLTVTDSADLYAVNISNTTVMDRTTDFTDVTAISADTLFAPGVNAYAQVTINDGVTATVSPAGTTFANNGSGIIVDSIQQEGGTTKWKLPLVDGSDGTAIVTDGAGGFKVKGASAGGPATLNPQGETLIHTTDFMNYTPDTNFIEFIVPTSLATNTSDIETFRVEINFVSMYNSGSSNSDNTNIFFQPMTAKGSRLPLSTSSWDWMSGGRYNSSSGNLAWVSRSGSGSSNEGNFTTSNGTYYGKDYGLGVVFGGNQNYFTTSDYYEDTPPNFTNTASRSQWHSSITGEVRIYNNIHSPQFMYDITGFMSQSSSSWNYTSTSIGGAKYRSSNSSNNYPITGEHARGYRMWFLPTNYNYKDTWKISGGRINVYANLKQSQAQITVGDTA